MATRQAKREPAAGKAHTEGDFVKSVSELSHSLLHFIFGSLLILAEVKGRQCISGKQS